MAKKMASKETVDERNYKENPMTREEVLAIIDQAGREEWEALGLDSKYFSELPSEIGQLEKLKTLSLSDNQLVTIPESIGRLTELKSLDLSMNKLISLPETIGGLIRLEDLTFHINELSFIPKQLGVLSRLRHLNVGGNQLGMIPDSIMELTDLEELYFYRNGIKLIPPWIKRLKKLKLLEISANQISELPDEIGELLNLGDLRLGYEPAEGGNPLKTLPTCIRNNQTLQAIHAYDCRLVSVPDWIGELKQLKILDLMKNELHDLPISIGQLPDLSEIRLEKNPLNPALQSAYEQGQPALRAFLHSLKIAEPLFEAKLVFVGEGGVGKTTLLRALSGKKPREGEPTTHGVSIDVHSMLLPHPDHEEVRIQFNAWDFGGQEVYRVTHQFFFSKRSVYLLVWEPRIGVQQSQVEDWLKLIRLRVGDDAKVIIVSTHAKTGRRIARIDKPVFLRDYGSMIVDFIEVDSLESDLENPNEKYNIPKLKQLIANAAKDLEQMGMPFAISWKLARDELIELGKTMPRVNYAELSEVCSHHGLDDISTKTLAGLMHDLGYIVYYSDDERLKDDVVLQPEWLTKAISFVLEDRTTQERDGILPDNHLEDVWLKHNFINEPHYDKELYPFFLRLMEKYDVSYRLQDGDASLVAQHVPQVRPNLPWQPEEEPKEKQRRLGMVCVMDEAPPGLVPWMIVRTHEYAYKLGDHRLHWQKGMFLRNKRHGEAMLELRGREFHMYTEAFWPKYFMNVLRQTLDKLIADNWPGMEGRYAFTVPCQNKIVTDALKLKL